MPGGRQDRKITSHKAGEYLLIWPERVYCLHPVSASVFALSSQRHCIKISKLVSSSPPGKDITCHQNAGFARTMICLSRLVIELCLLLNIMWNGHRIKGATGTCKACLPEHSQDCSGTFLLLSLHSLERTTFPRTCRLTIRLTFHLFLTQDTTPGHL